jgi:hypothetical protein
MVAFNDHQIIQTDDRDQNPYGKELQEDSVARQQLQPSNSNVVQQNTCLSPAHKDEGGKDKKYQKHLTLCTASTHQQTRRINDEGITGRAAIRENKKADLRKQAKGLRKVHLQNCLINAIEKKQKSHAVAIKQKINREDSKRMWYLIKQTAKDPQSPSVLKVQRVINGKVKEYEVQEDVKNAIQQECKVCFSLAHSVGVMPH